LETTIWRPEQRRRKYLLFNFYYYYSNATSRNEAVCLCASFVFCNFLPPPPAKRRPNKALGRRHLGPRPSRPDGAPFWAACSSAFCSQGSFAKERETRSTSRFRSSSRPVVQLCVSRTGCKKEPQKERSQKVAFEAAAKSASRPARAQVGLCARDGLAMAQHCTAALRATAA